MWICRSQRIVFSSDTLLWCLQDARCIFAIHNLSHQGVEPAATYGNFGLPEDWYAELY